MSNKTVPEDTSPGVIIDNINDPERKDDARIILRMMEDIAGEKPVVWGTGIIGFGTYHYKYASGREGDWFKVGFSPRKNEFSLYIMAGFDRYPGLMSRLGKYKTGKSCLYVKKLSDIDEEVLRELIRESILYIDKTYPES
jgi:hypothetical protein